MRRTMEVGNSLILCYHTAPFIPAPNQAGDEWRCMALTNQAGYSTLVLYLTESRPIEIAFIPAKSRGHLPQVLTECVGTVQR